MTAPLIDLAEPLVVDIRANWTVYIGDDEPRHVPASVRAKWCYVRHVCVCGPFGVQFWWQGSDDGDKWYWADQTG